VNVGFAQAANQAVGLLSGGAEWLLLLNPDVELAKDIDEIVAEMAEMAGAAHAVVVAGRLTASNGTAPNAKPLPGLLFELCRAVAGTSATLGLFSFFSHTRCSSPCDFRVVPQLDGAFMLMRKETFERLQGFDERFELYFEDADFCRRVRHTGGCLLATRVVGMHHAGHAARQARDDALAAFGVSRIRYLRKWWPLLGAPTAAACAILEFISRSLSARPEGRHARRRALRAQLMELLAPGSQTVLAKQRLSTR
jgi:GT2 family glycosyltransferase